AIDVAAQQPGGDRQIVACQCPATGGGKPVRGALAKRLALRVERSQLAPVLVRLLQVPTDGLVVLRRVPHLRLDPVGQLLVQLGARTLEQAPVGSIAATALREKWRPTTAARSSRLRCSGRKRSMRAASKAWIVGGISRAANAT